jgi:adenylate cyclase
MTLISKERVILFADVADSTAIYELLGDKPAAKSIDGCLTVLAAEIVRCRGTVVKRIGDEIMAVFPLATDACQAATSMQLAIDAQTVTNGVKHAIKVGFHFGHVLEGEQDFWGDAVNTAARLTQLARRGQILTTSTTAETFDSQQFANTRDHADHSVKGKQDALHVIEVVWEDDLEATQILKHTAKLQLSASLQLSSLAGALAYPEHKASIWLGRDGACDVVNKEGTASRRHARIENRRNQFFLVDDSTNGTYLQIGGAAEVLLRREQVLLRESGTISLGTPAAKAVDVIAFVVNDTANIASSSS